ncbi:myxococcus cysteine-rich repeat containing protein [Myxococcota bacterium]|nr:myxococcus cysteine-rich repeat containing protein [Myxococcota bacterium]
MTSPARLAPARPTPAAPRVAVALSLVAALTAACTGSSVDADFTALELLVFFDGDAGIDTLAVSGLLDDGTAAFMPGTIPVAALTDPPARRRESALLVLPASLTGLRAVVTVEGRAGALAVARGTDEVRFVLGQSVTSSVSLAVPSTCGDGSVEPTEACDDGNSADDDGCDRACAVERDFVCAFEPSRCFDDSTTLFVDAGAGCPGDGSAARPFCRIGLATSAPRVETVIVRRGLYRETLALSAVRLDVLAEPGAVVESAESPAVRVGGGAVVELAGLSVRGEAGTEGGGVAIDGATTVAELRRVEIGPSAALGVAATEGASVVLAESRVLGNTKGGALVDTESHWLENVIVAANGSETSTIGGLRIVRSSSAARLANLTIVDNVMAASDGPGGGAGILCTVAASIVNSIVWGNDGGPPISDTCRASYSDLGPFDGAPPSLGTSFSEDPMLDATYHLQAGSPCIDRGDPTGIVPAGVAPAIDVDGDPRPAGAQVDVGADERS